MKEQKIIQDRIWIDKKTLSKYIIDYNFKEDMYMLSPHYKRVFLIGEKAIKLSDDVLIKIMYDVIVKLNSKIKKLNYENKI